jgi:hypothetical protein
MISQSSCHKYQQSAPLVVPCSRDRPGASSFRVLQTGHCLLAAAAEVTAFQVPSTTKCVPNFRTKSSAARTSCLPRAQVVCQPHRMPGHSHKSSDTRTDCLDARTDSQDCRTASRMSAQVAGRAHSSLEHALKSSATRTALPDTRTGRLTTRTSSRDTRTGRLPSPVRNVAGRLRNMAGRLRTLIECGRSLISAVEETGTVAAIAH